MELWTTDQVANYTGLTVAEVYASRRRGDFPGVLGFRRGRALLYDAEKVRNPPEPEVTSDPIVAILWELQAQTRLLHQIIHNTRPNYLTGELLSTEEEPND